MAGESSNLDHYKRRCSVKEVTDKSSYIERVFNQVVSKEVQDKLNELTQVVNNEITKQMNKILQDYSEEIKTKVEDNINFASIKDQIVKIPPVVVRIPERKIIIPLAGLANFPEKISIPWPNELKKISLRKPLTYDIPEIPLSRLNYEKEISIKVPGFQTPSLQTQTLRDCISKPPTGGNPCPIGQFQNNLEKIKSIRGQINETSEKIIHILE